MESAFSFIPSGWNAKPIPLGWLIIILFAKNVSVIPRGAEANFSWRLGAFAREFIFD
jgi:hypothetical protein